MTWLYGELKGTSFTEWRRLRPNPLAVGEGLTPEWVVFHLVEHEAGHAFQVSSLKARGMRDVERGLRIL